MRSKSILWIAVGSALLLTACSLPLPVLQQTPQVPSPSPTLAIIFTPTFTQTPAPPTATPEPLAAQVNGEGISLSEFDQEMARYRLSGVTLAEQAGQTAETYVLNMMIDERLLAQAAAAAGFVPGEAEIQARLDSLSAQVDLTAWMAAQGYDDASLRRSLKRAMQAAWMRDQIAAETPATAEQVHAVQILLYNSTDAAAAYSQAQGAEDFLALAREYHPTTGGEMGWFARGSLFYPALEEAAFSLQPGTFSQVVQTELGYHIIYIVERQADRQLDPQALRNRQSAAIAEWLTTQRSLSSIVVLAEQGTP